MRANKALSFSVTVIAALALLSGAIALPILFRPFYYAHIKPLGLDVLSGMDFNAVKHAYDCVLNYCTGLTSSFSAGDFSFSAEGAAHFADVRKLFILDIAIFVITIVVLTAVFIVLKKKGKSLYKPRGHSALFWAAILLVAVFAVLAVVVSINFTAAFEIFHKLFFPGKTNWTFNPYLDPVIIILPEVFFRNCAIFIFANLVVSCSAILITDIIKRKRAKK